jgi:predicted DNA-binding transcriptional regulator AlpA
VKNDPFDVIAKYSKPSTKPNNVVGDDASVVDQIVQDGEIVAVLICSKILESHIWLAFSDDFNPPDGQAVFYCHELELLKKQDAGGASRNPQIQSQSGLRAGVKGEAVTPLLDSKAVCGLLRVSPATLSRLVRANKIPPVLLGTGKTKMTVRFRESELENWLDRRSRGAVAKDRPLAVVKK